MQIDKINDVKFINKSQAKNTKSQKPV